jgi:hypothetical protein
MTAHVSGTQEWTFQAKTARRQDLERQTRAVRRLSYSVRRSQILRSARDHPVTGERISLVPALKP